MGEIESEAGGVIGIKERCRGKWGGLLAMYGVDSRYLNGRHGPCPLCGGKDRFRFDNKQGDGTWICNQCGAGNGIDLLMKIRNWDFKECATELEKSVGSVTRQVTKARRSNESVKSMIDHLWNRGVPVQAGDPVALYLANRGLDLPRFPTSLRYVEHCKHNDKTLHPAMIAAVHSADGEIVQVHRTFLTRDGQKADVDPVRLLMPGELPKGSAVRFGDPKDVIGIAEGIETALSAAIAHRVPVWAALTAGRLMTWEPPTGVSEVIIFGDHDTNYTGHAHAYGLANKLSVKHSSLHVVVSIPDKPGDWNDVYSMEAAE